MDSSMEGMLDTYLLETNSLLDNLDEMLIADEKVGTFSTDDVNEIFRTMHTIKGSSAMMEFNSISVIAHKMEDLFFFIRDKGIDYLTDEDRKDLFNLLFKSEDFLRGEVGKVEAGEPLLDNVDEFNGKIAAFMDRISRDEARGEAAAKGEAVPAEAPAPAAAPAAPAPAAAPAAGGAASIIPADDKAAVFIHISLEEGVGMENLRAFMIVNALKECDITFRAYPEHMDTDSATSQVIIESGFYLAFDSEDQAKKAEGVLPSQNHIRDYEVISPDEARKQVGGAAPEPAPAPAAESAASAKQEAPAASPAAAGPAASAPAAASAKEAPKNAKTNGPVKQSLISVNLQKLDSLMDLVGEIVITESMVTSSPVLKQLPQEAYDSFNKSARQLRKLTDDLQDISMSLRMVPISGVFQKMNRIVRDMKQKLNKDVKLTLIGEDTEVDKTIVDAIQDPIMHIVRNSMDHGIEKTKEERLSAGKPAQGEIILKASHSSSEVVISCSDDGYGMDPDVMLSKAEEKGILTKPKSEYSTKEALQLILLPGFSTNKTVTEYSGRGVGMDVVKKNVESVGGNISIESEVGKGTTITMKIPLTLAIMDGMKVTVGDSIFTIPIVNINQSFKVEDKDIVLDESGNEMIERMGVFYPVVRLDRFYGIQSSIDTIEDGIMIWVEASDKSCCLFVDELVGEQQVVVKPLPQYFNNFDLKGRGITGCTILGDGNISIILDVLGVYTAAVENA